MEGLYFYLSRSHTDRDPGHPDPDFWVTRVFNDLCAAVERDRTLRQRWRVGYLDPCVGGDDNQDEASRALAVAEVFVALYSFRYLSDLRCRNQRTWFLSRFGGEPPERAEPHVLPVLWEPNVNAMTIPEFRQAIDLMPRSREYAEVGLTGLLRVSHYRECYERLLARLSQWIVDVANGSPVGRHQSAWAPSSGVRGWPDDSFVIAVLAPCIGEKPQGRRMDRYGREQQEWRPFGSAQPMPVAHHIAGRSPTHQSSVVVDFNPEVDHFASHPGILIVDPWIMALPAGRARLERALDRLPEWAPAIVLADQNDPQYDLGFHHVEDATDLCRIRGPKGIDRLDLRTIEAFDQVIPYWVHFANRRFLSSPGRRHGRSFPGRPRLGRPPTEEEESTGDD